MKLLIAFAVVGTLLGRAGQAPEPTLNDLAWIAGSWTGATRGIEMEEHWTAPKGDSMIGIHRDLGKGRTLAFEFLRIEQHGAQIVYLSMPNGRAPTHDFPQRIIYWKDGADLRARIEGTINGKAGSEEWRWRPGALK